MLVILLGCLSLDSFPLAAALLGFLRRRFLLGRAFLLRWFLRHEKYLHKKKRENQLYKETYIIFYLVAEILFCQAKKNVFVSACNIFYIFGILVKFLDYYLAIRHFF